MSFVKFLVSVILGGKKKILRKSDNATLSCQGAGQAKVVLQRPRSRGYLYE